MHGTCIKIIESLWAFLTAFQNVDRKWMFGVDNKPSASSTILSAKLRVP